MNEGGSEPEVHLCPVQSILLRKKSQEGFVNDHCESTGCRWSGQIVSGC